MKFLGVTQQVERGGADKRCWYKYWDDITINPDGTWEMGFHYRDLSGSGKGTGFDRDEYTRVGVKCEDGEIQNLSWKVIDDPEWKYEFTKKIDGVDMISLAYFEDDGSLYYVDPYSCGQKTYTFKPKKYSRG
jgi:hypothetical protein